MELNGTQHLQAIPLREQEQPVVGYAGFVFKNQAWHCRPEHLFPAADLDTAEEQWKQVMTLYFANFCEPVRNLANEIHCVACNAKLTGPYGMADWRSRQALNVDESEDTAEARCTGCGYPARCNHTLKMPDGRLLVKLSWLPLMYHPTTLSGGLRSSN
jgi:hypothetical protein